MSKLCRADAGDLDDIQYPVQHLDLAPDDVRKAIREAVVPPDFVEAFPTNQEVLDLV